MEEDKLFFSQKLKKVNSRIKQLKEFQNKIPSIEYSLDEEMKTKFIPLEELETLFS